MPIRSSRQNQNAFTLFEILISITVLGLMASSYVLVIPTQIMKARDARRKTHLERIKTSFYNYLTDAGCFPSSLPACGQKLSLSSTVYLEDFPCDPQGSAYVYLTDGSLCSQNFRLFANLENPDDKSIDFSGCRQGCGPDCLYNYGVSSTNINPNFSCPLEPSPTPSPTTSPPTTPAPPSPTPEIHLFACSPSRRCIEYSDPARSRCPYVFADDPTCQDLCQNSDYLCHDESGKKP